MISRRTWALLAGTAIALIVSLLYWEQRPKAYKVAPGEVGWDLVEVGPTPHEGWLTLGELCGAASALSLLVDFIWDRRRSRDVTTSNR